jgi:hypothetical protein
VGGTHGGELLEDDDDVEDEEDDLDVPWLDVDTPTEPVLDPDAELPPAPKLLEGVPVDAIVAEVFPPITLEVDPVVPRKVLDPLPIPMTELPLELELPESPPAWPLAVESTPPSAGPKPVDPVPPAKTSREPAALSAAIDVTRRFMRKLLRGKR